MSDCPACGQNNPSDSRFCGTCGKALPDPSAPSGLVGRIIADRYRVLRVVAVGGMGIIYEAEQTMGERVRSVALKTLLPELSRDQVVVSRFTRECAVVASLEHPNTVRVYDFGKTLDGILYIAMEFVRGRPLGDVLAEGPLALSRCLVIVEQIALALDEAHRQGIVHRDLKPDNVVLSERAGIHDFVKLLDFGIAKRSSHGGKFDTKLTQQGMVLGTPPYMAPEQFSSEPLDRTCDIYALAVIVYEMLNGRLPFEADTPWQWAHHHLSSTPDPFRVAVPKAVEQVVFSAMSKLPAQRPASTIEFFRQLSAAAGGIDGSRRAVKTEPSVAVEPKSSRTCDDPVVHPWGNTEAPRCGLSQASTTDTGRTEPEMPVVPTGQPLAGASSYVSTGTAAGASSYDSTGTAPAAPPLGAQASAVGASAVALPAGPVRPLAPRPRRRGAWGWVLGVGLLLVGAAAAAGALFYDSFEQESTMPPLPSVPTTDPDAVIIAVEPAQTTFVRSQSLSGGARVSSPVVLSPSNPIHSLGQGGSTAVSTSSAGGSAPSATSATSSTNQSNPLSFPFPFPIPTGIIPNPFPQGATTSTAPTTATSTTATTTPTTPTTPTAAGLASCTQARTLAASNMDAAVDQYLVCQNSVGVQAAQPTQRVLAAIGYRRVVTLARQGQCAEAQSIISALSRIGAQARAQAALSGTSCAG